MAFELTKPFIESLLGQKIHEDFTISAGCQAGDGVACTLHSIKVRTEETNEEMSVLFKTFLPPGDGPFDAREAGVFRTESAVYGELAPYLEELIRSKGGNYKVPGPKVFKTFNDDQNDYICMEDLRVLGYKMPNKYKGLTYPETSLIVKELAKFHAATYFLIHYSGEQIFSVEPPGKFKRLGVAPWKTPEKTAEFSFALENAVENAVELLEGCGKVDLAQKLRTAAPPGEAYEIMGKISESVDKTHFPVILHGDFWSNNMLLKYDEAGVPVSVKFVDFQLTRRGPIYEDLVYFIITSTDTEFRSRHLLQTLKNYYVSFKDSLEAISFPLPSNFTLGSVVDSFFGFTRSSLVQMTFAIPLQLGQPPSISGPGQSSGAEVGLENNNKGEKKAELHEDDGKEAGASTANKDPIDLDPAVEAAKMFKASLLGMMTNSPRAIKRLEEITQEILGDS